MNIQRVIFGWLTAILIIALLLQFALITAPSVSAQGEETATYWFGGKLRAVQTGRIQHYFMLALIIFIGIGAALYFLVWS